MWYDPHASEVSTPAMFNDTYMFFPSKKKQNGSLIKFVFPFELLDVGVLSHFLDGYLGSNRSGKDFAALPHLFFKKNMWGHRMKLVSSHECNVSFVPIFVDPSVSW